MLLFSVLNVQVQGHLVQSISFMPNFRSTCQVKKSKFLLFENKCMKGNIVRRLWLGYYSEPTLIVTKNMHILTYFTSIVAMESNSLIVVILINYICALKNNIHFCLRYFRNKGYEYCYYIDNLDVYNFAYIYEFSLLPYKNILIVQS